eukprot:201671-Pyramimonas_sp.AAC.1
MCGGRRSACGARTTCRRMLPQRWQGQRLPQRWQGPRRWLLQLRQGQLPRAATTAARAATNTAALATTTMAAKGCRDGVAATTGGHS